MKKDRIIKKDGGIEEFVLEDFGDIEIIYVEEEDVSDSGEGHRIESGGMKRDLSAGSVNTEKDEGESEEKIVTDEELKRVFDKAYRDGYKEGYSKGYEEGRSFGYSEARREFEATYSREIDNLRENIARLVENFKSRLDEWVRDLYNCEDDLVSIVMDAVKIITANIPKEDVVRSLVKSAISKIEGNGKVVLRVNPVVLTYLEDIGLPSNFKLVGDEGLGFTDVVLESTRGILESKLEDRIREFVESILECYGKIQES